MDNKLSSNVSLCLKLPTTTDGLEGLWIPHPWRHLKPDWTQAWVVSCSWLCFEQRVGLAVQRYLPISKILWFLMWVEKLWTWTLRIYEVLHNCGRTVRTGNLTFHLTTKKTLLQGVYWAKSLSWYYSIVQDRFLCLLIFFLNYKFFAVQTTWTCTCGGQWLIFSFCIHPESYFLFLHELYRK